MTDKDADDMEFALDLGVDWIALSFMRTSHDVLDARTRADALGVDCPIIAKLERPESIDNLASLVAVADGVMVARRPGCGDRP
jgi:pyruvate kinase